MSKTGLVQVTTTLPSRVDAEAMASGVLDVRLAACAQVSGPVTSHYVWKGELCREEEWLCVMKTPATHADRLMGFVREAHPYEVPEIIAVQITDVLPAYMEWARESVGNT